MGHKVTFNFELIKNKIYFLCQIRLFLDLLRFPISGSRYSTIMASEICILCDTEPESLNKVLPWIIQDWYIYTTMNTLLVFLNTFNNYLLHAMSLYKWSSKVFVICFTFSILSFHFEFIFLPFHLFRDEVPFSYLNLIIMLGNYLFIYF